MNLEVYHLNLRPPQDEPAFAIRSAVGASNVRKRRRKVASTRTIWSRLARSASKGPEKGP